MKPFHYAFPVHDLKAARDFYGTLLGCSEGRSSEKWIDFNLYGHQIVAHLVTPHPTESGTHSALGASPSSTRPPSTNSVDGQSVPVPHFGVVLDWDDWQVLANRLRDRATAFVIAPCVRFEGQIGEQATMFFTDPSGNALEFKAFKDPSQLFAQ